MGGGSSERVFRRLQVVGRASYSISLPKQWVISRGLKPGDFIEVSEALDGSLRLSPPEARLRRSSCRINADLCKDEDRLGRLLAAGYRIGYDFISVISSKASPSELARALEKTISGLPGFELSYEKPSELVVRNVLDYSRFSIDDLVKRCYLIASEIFNNLTHFLERGRYDLIRYVETLRDRLGELCQLHTRLMMAYLRRRELGRHLKLRSPAHIYSSIAIPILIKGLADNLLSLVRVVARFRRKLWASPQTYEFVRKVLERLSDSFDKAFNAYLSLDFDQANRMLGEQVSWGFGEELAKMGIKDKALVEFLSRLDTLCGQIHSILREISQLALDLFVESSSPVCAVGE